MLLSEGYDGTPGSTQTVPGMACVFGFFAIAVVGFAIFREHGWRTWPRLRAAGLGGRRAARRQARRARGAARRAARRAVRLRRRVPGLQGQRLVARGRADRARVRARWCSCAGLAAAAALSTIQQVNAVTNLGAMVLGGLGGALVPVDGAAGVGPADRAGLARLLGDGGLPRPSILDGGGVGDVLAPAGRAGAFAAAVRGDRAVAAALDAPKRTWG